LLLCLLLIISLIYYIFFMSVKNRNWENLGIFWNSALSGKNKKIPQCAESRHSFQKIPQCAEFRDFDQSGQRSPQIGQKTSKPTKKLI
jgi:hypothetical protein